ncbi:YraN family protein [Devosia beringensis]|uniref:YraN family protein n=1 Tax=Devosia beringensis TaxID=2657486 RepID=UPI00186B7789|nr:YraN family protein [Devosia beringensis]
MPRSPLKPGSKARIAAYRGGHRGEALAAWYLRLKFYRILARRYRTPLGEIDLIAERWGTIVFVEVKARARAESLLATFESINRGRIVRAADYWLSRNPRLAGRDRRFDVIFLARWRWPYHLANAFGG